MAKETAPTESRQPLSERGTSPTISIYQNPDHVVGILQQAYRAPLLTEGSTESHQDQTKTTGSGLGGNGEAGAGFNVPGLADARLKLGGDYSRHSGLDVGSGAKSAQSFIYSQAYYLYKVREALGEQGAITAIESRAQAAGVRSGDFVEFRASFQPNEIHALLDILTPDLVAAITEYQIKSTAIAGADDEVWHDHQVQTVFLQRVGARSRMRADLARAVADAIRVDFRSVKTREFYGSIGAGDEAVTAITICDNAHFVVEDEDRILDGEFTVLGKVTGAVRDELPVFDRNKLLARLNPEAVDQIFKELRSMASVSALQPGLSTGGIQLKTVDDLFDFALASRIAGPSFKVIPVAIYV